MGSGLKPPVHAEARTKVPFFKVLHQRVTALPVVEAEIGTHFGATAEGAGQADPCAEVLVEVMLFRRGGRRY